MNIDVSEVQRYIDDLDEKATAAVHKALVSTLHFMLSLRNGACYRYEKEILEGVVECSRSHHESHLRRIKQKRDGN